MVKLSTNFDSSEFLVSKDHPALASAMKLRRGEINRLKLLCESVLQPLRTKFGPLHIQSGKRSPELNQAVGGSATSDHLYSIAADISTPIKTLDVIFQWAIQQNLPYRQLIYYPFNNFVHISINIPGKEYKHEALEKQIDGSYKYIG